MANTYEKIGSTATVGAGGASSVTLSSIPSTYTDLIVVYSLRGNSTEGVYIQFNGSTSGFTSRYLYADGSNVSSAVLARYLGSIVQTASTFTNGSIYITGYAESNHKAFGVDEVYEQNSTAGFNNLVAHVWANTAPITSITLEAASGLNQYSTVSLYGIKKS